ncbi:MAG TPA: hypothetical protein VH815_14505 [Acidobacteriota bacterium]
MKKYSLIAIFILIGITPLFASDPLSTEIAKWKEFVRTNPATDEDWTSLKQVLEPVIERAEIEVTKGRRFSALHLLALVRSNLAASKFLADHAAEVKEFGLFEQEWQKVGKSLGPVLNGKQHLDLNGYPAAVRAVAEVSYSEIKVYYDSSIEYGKATEPTYGMFYLGSAQGQYDFTQFCKTLRAASTYTPLTIGNFENEIESFEDTVLAAYKPPLSIDQHPIFIRVSAMIKQAHELYDAGAYYGALYRYLEARYRYFRALEPGQAITADQAAARAQEFEKRFNQNSADNTIGRIFLELGLSEAQDTTPNTQGGTNARVLFDDVLPHYFSSIEPAKTKRAVVTPVTTVTLVRWPYT